MGTTAQILGRSFRAQKSKRSVAFEVLGAAMGVLLSTSFSAAQPGPPTDVTPPADVRPDAHSPAVAFPPEGHVQVPFSSFQAKGDDLSDTAHPDYTSVKLFPMGLHLGNTARARLPSVRTLFAPVYPPHGASLDQVDCFFRDNDDDASYHPLSFAKLERLDPTDGSVDEMALVNVSTVDESGHVTESSSVTAASADVDTSTYQYHMRVDLVLDGFTDFFDPLFLGCRISYSFSR